MNGNEIRYSAAGEKLRVTHLTAVPNITVPTGTARELAPSEILSADSTDYLLGGTLTMRNGRIDKYLFDEGYCQASKVPSNPAKDKFAFYYYDRDHLGSVRQVIIANGTDKGTVAQKMNYYPSGLQFCDGRTDSDKQSRRYNGKEYDKMHGLNTYDYGARQYNPVTARWDRVDTLCEKYYSVSPYVYCAGNPMNAVDPDGRRIIDNKGRNAVYVKKGNIILTKYANNDITRIVNTLKQTQSGRKILISAIYSDVNISIIISPNTNITQNGSSKDYTYGETKQGNSNEKDNYGIRITNGHYSITEASITIYEGTIVEDSKTSNAKHKGLTTDQAIAAVASHEFVHASDPSEIDKDISSQQKNKTRKDGEEKANSIEKIIIDEFIELNKRSNENN